MDSTYAHGHDAVNVNDGETGNMSNQNVNKGDVIDVRAENQVMFTDEEDLQSIYAPSGPIDQEVRDVTGLESRTAQTPNPTFQGEKVARLSSARARASNTATRRKPGMVRIGSAFRNTRARAKKPNEPDPFLCIDTVTTRKVTLPENVPACAPSTRINSTGQRKEKEGPGICESTPPSRPTSRNGNRSGMGRSGASSAISTEWNPLVPRQKPLSASNGKNRINHLIKVPFKHTVNPPALQQPQERVDSPGQAMKEQTAAATMKVARTMARQRGEEETRISGRLLKGRLKPLYPVRLSGPSITQCMGVVAGAELDEDPLKNSNSRTLERRRKIIESMTSKEFVLERPRTADGFRRSAMSNSSKSRDNELVKPLSERLIIVDSINQLQNGLKSPPNSAASASDTNMRDNHPNTANRLSSDVFEIEEIPRTSAPPITVPPITVPTSTVLTSAVPKIVAPTIISKPKSYPEREIRPATGKSVTFAEENETFEFKEPDTPKESEVTTCPKSVTNQENSANDNVKDSPTVSSKTRNIDYQTMEKEKAHNEKPHKVQSDIENIVPNVNNNSLNEKPSIDLKSEEQAQVVVEP